MNVKAIVPLLVVATGIGAAASILWYTSRPLASGILEASGMLEAEEVTLSSELGGRLLTRLVREGEPISRGQVLAQLDTDLLNHQIQTAQDPSARNHLEQQRDRQTVRSPIEGWVVRTPFEPAENVPPGVTVVVVADYNVLTLKVFLPEDKFGRVSLGQQGSVSVDAYPGERFWGDVEFISSKAEFAPRDVQTKEDRVKTVYAIKLRVPNPDLRLKPGMFGDVQFVDQGS